MSDAHEKTRIRQLEDAAAHWEHKYANARQYNRNLEARIASLDADNAKLREALQRIAAYSPGLTPILGDPIEIARDALAASAKQEGEP